MPNALRLALNNCVVPNARTDADGAGFRQKEWKDAQVHAIPIPHPNPNPNSSP